VRRSAVRRRATITWLDRPPEGHGRVRVDSRAFTALPISAPADDEPNPREVTPGELLAAAHGAIFLGALAELLEDDGVPARELVVDADCEIGGEKLDHRVTAVEFSVHGIVEGVEESRFEASAGAALDRLRDWLGIGERVPLTVSAHLRGAVRRSG
jgi:organic hydroperoxide reductase OsmC/OhrA